jgi:hypothetical protein
MKPTVATPSQAMAKVGKFGRQHMAVHRAQTVHQRLTHSIQFKKHI